MESLGQDTSGDIDELKDKLAKANIAKAIRLIYWKKNREKTKLVDQAKALMKGLIVHVENVAKICTPFLKDFGKGCKFPPLALDISWNPKLDISISISSFGSI